MDHQDRRILIVTMRADLHADIVARKIVERGATPFRLNLDEFPEHFTITLEQHDGGLDGVLCHIPTGDRLSLSEVGAVWMRKKADFSFLAGALPAQEKAFAEAEMEHVMFGLLYCLDCYWMSHPLAARGAMWKGEQLMRAARAGFAVPPSMVTNQRDRLETFRTSLGGDIIFKALSSSTLGGLEVTAEERTTGNLGTTRITEAHADLLDAVAELPCFFQQHIAKQCDVRATVIGDRIFAARIHSQDDPRTVTDFRDFSVEIPYEVEDLPPDVARRCIDFVHSYGLNFGALDLVVNPEGEYVFLENNPVGQFLFVEQLVPALNMTDEVAACLIRGANAQRTTS